jgi:hypothetical protein
VIAGDDHAPFRAGATHGFFEVLQFDIPKEIQRRQARAPKQINHGPREMLKRFTDNLAPLTGR